MQKLLTLILLLGASFSFAQHTHKLPAGTTISIDKKPDNDSIKYWKVASPFQKGINKVEYVLPANLKTGQRYPVVYMLPVNAGTKGEWGHPLVEVLRNDLANKYQAIFVCPAYDALPWYGNNPTDTSFRQVDYFLNVVIPLVESKLPAADTSAQRYIIGFSKSAFGALGIFLKNLDMFSRIALFESYYGVPTAKQWEEWSIGACYGTRESFDEWDTEQLIDQHYKELTSLERRITLLSKPNRLRDEALINKLRSRKVPICVIQDDKWQHSWSCGWIPAAVATILSK